MKTPAILFALATLAFAPEAQSGPPPGPPQGPVAEIVTYRLRDGVDPQRHKAAAQDTIAFLSQTGAVISRTLSVDETGLWTDHILWTSRAAAKKAEAQAMQRPEFGAFFSGMDEATVTLRHAPVMMQME